MGKEYWLAPEFDFCSCDGYYFARLKGAKSCYHLDSVRLAQKQGNVEVIKFSDDEYSDFLKSLLADL